MIDEIIRRAKLGEPKYTYEDLLRERKDDFNKRRVAEARDHKEGRLKSIIGRSGIMPIHQNCSLDNYVVDCDLQAKAHSFAKGYIDNFDNNSGQCFIFSGSTGTGKNHLSAAICNSLMARGKSCLIITVNELMIKSRECYRDNPKFSEDEFIKHLVNFDLLIIDEIGLQKGTDHEKIVLNQVVDQRIGNLKPIGILTNLGKEPIEKVLGERIVDRLRSNGRWVEFNWKSYR